MPTPKQMEKLATAVGKNVAPSRPIGPADELTAEYWEALLRDAPADDRGSGTGILRMRRLADIPQHMLRVAETIRPTPRLSSGASGSDHGHVPSA